MINKKQILNSVFVVCFSVLITEISIAQMVGPDAYIQGTKVEVGVNGAGGFEGVDQGISPPPAGYHARTNTLPFGFIADPNVTGWTAFNGDFFTPGTPENGWGIEIGASGTTASNNDDNDITFSGQRVDIPGTITSYVHTAGQTSMDWEGTDTTGGTNLHVKINYLLYDTNFYYQTTISITNNTGATIPDMYYYRNFDPDNDEEIGFDFTTQNTIVSQPVSGGSSTASVSATSVIPSTQPMSYVALIGLDSNWRAGYGGFVNRDASDAYFGTGFTQTVGSSAFVDEAIMLGHRIQNLPPSATHTFRFFVSFDTVGTASVNNLVYLSYPGSPAAVGQADTVRSCGGGGTTVEVQGGITNYTWSWSPSTGLSTTTGPSVVVTPAATTTYTVTGTPISGPGAPLTFTFVAINNPLPAATLSSVPGVCSNGTPFLLSGGSPAGGVYSGPGVVGGTTFSPSGSPGVFTLYYTYTDANSCSATASGSIVVYPAPTATLASFADVCDTDPPFMLTGGSPAGGVYTSAGITSGSTFDPGYVGGGTYDVTYTYTTPHSCVSSVIKTIHVDICEGIAENTTNNGVVIYPTPFSDAATVSLGKNIDLKNTEMHIVDVLGNEVKAIMDIHSHEFTVERNNLADGIYFYRIMNDGKVIGEGKMLVK